MPTLNISKEEAKNKINNRGKIILSIGRLDPWKGFLNLVEVTKDLVSENPDFKLLIIGEGTEKEKLADRIKKLGLEEHIKLIGKVEHRRLPLYFQAADIFILNSAQEGFPHVILEAMQAGVAVITTNVGGNPELVEDGINGILVEYNDKEQIKGALVKLANDKNLQNNFIKNSKIKLQKFSWENSVAETLKALLS